jgi:hypothetical protein
MALAPYKWSFRCENWSSPLPPLLPSPLLQLHLPKRVGIIGITAEIASRGTTRFVVNGTVRGAVGFYGMLWAA